MGDKIPKNDLYVYDLKEEVFTSISLMSFDSKMNEVNVVDDVQTETVPVNWTSADSNASKVSRTDAPVPIKRVVSQADAELFRFNFKRRINGLDPVNQEQFDNFKAKDLESRELDDDSDESDHESDSEGDIEDTVPEQRHQYNADPFPRIIEEGVTRLNVNEEEAPETASHLNTQSPMIYFKSNKLYGNKVFGIYKSLFDDTGLQNPQHALSKWQQQDNTEHFSILLMIGGGHFAGAIVSHQRLSGITHSKKSQITVQEEAVQFLEHKTIHRYTTRRKQGGSQSASDNSKGKANSAGSTLRRYNEAALKTDVQSLLKTWEPYIKKCDNIYIRANSVSDRKIFLDNTCIERNDPRLKKFPFTTLRPTSNELRRAWCQLAYLSIVDKPTPDHTTEPVVRETDISKKTQESNDENTDRTVEEEHTEAVISFIQKSKAPLLISYIRKNRIDVNFELKPTSEFHYTPTMLHYASLHGHKHMVLVLLSTLKADPTCTNNNGKTAWDLAKDSTIRESFQLAREKLGENYTNWNHSHVGEPLTTEQIDALHKAKALEAEKEQEKLIQKEIQAVKEKLKEEKEAKRGPGRQLNSQTPNIQINLNSLNEDQRLRLMREQRARAAEARMKKFSGN